MYIQIKEDLVAKINSGYYQDKGRIPSQKALAKKYGASEITVRKALELLVNENYLYKVQGKGTFVADRRINRTLNLMSFTEEMRSKGLNCVSKILEVEELQDSRVAYELNITPEEPMLKVKRLRLTDGMPIALQSSYMPKGFIPEQYLRKINVEPSLYGILEKAGTIPNKAYEKYQACVLQNEEESALLGVKVGSPVFRVQRYTHSKGGVLFEYVESILRGDIYTVEVELDK